jgi:XTP/dITP diphosphohydrolase
MTSSLPPKASPATLLIATTSAGKLREWQALLGDLPLRLLTLQDVAIDFDVDETGTTFRANAVLKADAYGRASGLLTLAEDAGLCVTALGGAPGVYSARWEGSDYAFKNRRLIELLADRDGVARACRYACVVVLRHPDGRHWYIRGEVRGEVAREPAGDGGFGYDPIFWIPRLGQTLAQVSIDEKDRISHRGRAAGRVRPILRQLLEADDAR